MVEEVGGRGGRQGQECRGCHWRGLWPAGGTFRKKARDVMMATKTTFRLTAKSGDSYLAVFV
jgi:hypothetical protein